MARLTPPPRAERGASQPSPVAFDGFPEEALLFYEGLEADNSKAYWTDRRDVYERAVRGPLQALLDDLEPEFGAGKIFRPYRDVRFSADKTPYKTAAAALVPSGDGGGSFHVAAIRDFGVQPWLETPACRDAVADAWRGTAPLVHWLGRHVGPAEETEGERRGRRG